MEYWIYLVTFPIIIEARSVAINSPPSYHCSLKFIFFCVYANNPYLEKIVVNLPRIKKRMWILQTHTIKGLFRCITLSILNTEPVIIMTGVSFLVVVVVLFYYYFFCCCCLLLISLLIQLLEHLFLLLFPFLLSSLHLLWMLVLLCLSFTLFPVTTVEIFSYFFLPSWLLVNFVKDKLEVFYKAIKARCIEKGIIFRIVRNTPVISRFATVTTTNTTIRTNHV